MGLPQSNLEKITVRLTQSAAEIEAAQHLRYKVFYEEYGAKPNAEMARLRRDFDEYDRYMDHLVVVDDAIADPHQRIVGTYRLLRREAADKIGRFYTSGEYDIAPLLNSDATLLELGRSCVLAEYRTRPVLQMLWQGILGYMLDHNSDLLFGCASFPGTDVAAIAEQLSYLYHYHRAPDNLRPRALEKLYIDMDIIPKDSIDVKKSFNALPPLIKGYLRVGAAIGDGAIIDRQWDSIDVCIVLEMKQVSKRHLEFYGKRVSRAAAS